MQRWTGVHYQGRALQRLWRSRPDIEFPAVIASGDGPCSCFFGCRRSRTEQVVASSLRRRVNRAELAEGSLTEPLLAENELRRSAKLRHSPRERKFVESGCDAVTLGLGCLLPPSFVRRCPSTLAVAPFSHPAHRTGRAGFPHPALGQNLTPSPTTDRVQAV